MSDGHPADHGPGVPGGASISRGDAPPGAAVVVLEGELDLAISDRFHAVIDEVCSERPRLLVLDCEEVGFVDSTMLRELLRAHRELEGAGGRLVLAGPGPTVRRLLELTGTASLFEVADSRAAALASGT